MCTFFNIPNKAHKRQIIFQQKGFSLLKHQLYFTYETDVHALEIKAGFPLENVLLQDSLSEII